MATLIVGHDWSTTSLGPIEGWPQSLKAAVDIVVQMSMPALVCWGPDGVLLANDAFIAMGCGHDQLGFTLDQSWLGKHPFRDDIYRARNGEAGLHRDVEVDIAVEGNHRSAWYTLNFCPLHDEDGSVGGALAVFFETTDRVLVEGSLRESKRQLSAIFSEAQVGLSLLSLDGKFLRVNPELCHMLARPESVLLESGIADVTHPEDLPHSLKAVGELLKTGKSASIDKRYIHPDGTIVYANSIISLIETGSGAMILAVTVDLTTRRLAQDALAESEARFRALAEASPASIWMFTEEGTAIYANPRHAQLLGMDPSALLGRGWEQVLHPDERATVLREIEDAIKQRSNLRQRLRVMQADGQWHWMEHHAAPWFNAEGQYGGHVGITFDINDAVKAQEELLISNERLKLAIEGSGDGIWDWDLDKNEIVYSERARQVLCLDENEPADPIKSVARHVHPDDMDALVAALQACISGGPGPLRMEYRVREPNSGWRWVQARATVVARHPDQRPQRMTGTITDISEKRRSEQIVWEHANFDLLTGLPNRRLFRDRLDHELKKAHRTGTRLALLFIDLDRFKEANDLLGHTIGDELLVQAARRIRACVRQSDTVARLGGDEFTAILSELEDGSHVEMVAAKINETLTRPFYLGNEVVYLSASVGITLYPGDASDAENLIRNADQAMYAVKSQGRNHFSYFTPSMQREANERLHLISELRNALSREQLHVYYQPIIDLASGHIVKAEALLRWLHPRLGMVEPVRFIAFAEEAGLISEIGDWVFREAAGCSRRWGMRVGAPFPISINKSPVQFVSRLNEVNWLAYLKNLGLTGTSVSVEITEGMLLDASPAITAKLRQYHEGGIKVAIDDFGTGYSSIAYLKKFEVDYLKIDQSFVRDLGQEGGDRAIVRSIIAMAHELGLQVIAEGIETSEQKDFLIEGQCDFGQGFLFSEAVPAAQFEQLICA